MTPESAGRSSGRCRPVSGRWKSSRHRRARGGLNNGTAGIRPRSPSSAAAASRPATFTRVMWKKGTTEWLIEDLGTLPGDRTSGANDVNDSETVVGVSVSSTKVVRAFRWTPSTGMVALPGLGGETMALAIGNNGDVAGPSIDGAGNRHAVRWRARDNAIQDLGSLGGCCSEGYGINTTGTVVGVSDLGGGAVISMPFWLRREHA